MADEKVVAEVGLPGGVCRQITRNQETEMYRLSGWGVDGSLLMTKEELVLHLEEDRAKPKVLRLWVGVTIETIDEKIESGACTA